MAGLLGFTIDDLTGAIDSRKRQYGNLVRGLLSDPAATVEQLRAQDAEAARGNRYTQMSAGSVMPEVAQQGQEAVLNAAMNVGGLLGITAYHGSPHTFDKFDLGKAGSTTDAGELGRGIYFSTDPKATAGRAVKYTADVSLKNPLKLDMPDFKTSKRGVILKALGLPKDATAKDISAAAQKAGHDGVILDYSPTGYAHQELVAFDDKLPKILSRE